MHIFKLVNSCSHEAQQLLQIVESDNPFDVVFIDFWGLVEIPNQDGSLKILTCLYCMTRFGLASYTGTKEITSDQATRWAFGNFFVTFGISKIIVVGEDGLFL